MRPEPKPQVVLRSLTHDDVTARYVAWLNDPEVNRWLETRHTEQTIERVRTFVKDCNDATGSHLWGITIDGKHIGNIKLGPINPIHSYADLSYFIGDREEWGKGYATDAVRIAVKLGFAMGLHRIQAGVYGQNHASRRVLRKAGFAVEGFHVRQLKTANGWDDHFWYARLAESNVM